jgi:DNA replication protein DnaC
MSDFGIIIEQLRGTLKLDGMAEACYDVSKMPVHMRPGLEALLARMIETEIRHRDDARTQKLLRAAKLPIKAHVEDVICSAERNLTRDKWDALSDCSFVRRAENALVTGATGTGKSYAVSALAHQACSIGMKTLYLNMNHFVPVMKQAYLDGTSEKLLGKLGKMDLLILDDFGMQMMTADIRSILLTLVVDRYEKKSLIVTSQLPVNSWYEYIAENSVADAMLDRLFNGSHHIDLTGPSMRKGNRK